MKANNVVIEWEESDSGISVGQVQLTDIEDAAIVPPGMNIADKQVGIMMWRSPEAHTEARVNKPSDVFSFGVVVSRQAHYKPPSSLSLVTHYCV